MIKLYLIPYSPNDRYSLADWIKLRHCSNEKRFSPKNDAKQVVILVLSSHGRKTIVL